jgi:hypothetical protein
MNREERIRLLQAFHQARHDVNKYRNKNMKKVKLGTLSFQTYENTVQTLVERERNAFRALRAWDLQNDLVRHKRLKKE